MSAKIGVYDINGNTSGSMEIMFDISNFYLKHNALYRALHVLRSNAHRIRYSHYKNISGLQGSTRKIYQQKRTGRARQGSIRELHMRGGAVKFGFYGDKVKDKERRFKSYLNLNIKERRQATLAVICDKIRNHKLFVCESFNSEKFNKTSEVVKFLHSINCWDSLTIVYHSDLMNGFGNLPKIKLLHQDSVNLYSLLQKKNVLFERNSLNSILSKLLSKIKIKD